MNGVGRGARRTALPLDDAPLVLLGPGRAGQPLFAPGGAGVHLHAGGKTRRLPVPHGRHRLRALDQKQVICQINKRQSSFQTSHSSWFGRHVSTVTKHALAAAS